MLCGEVMCNWPEAFALVGCVFGIGFILWVISR